MATLSRGQTFGATETVTNTKLHNLVDLGSIANIVAADISPSANILDTQLADITTGNKVRGTALGNLASIPGSAGYFPIGNIPFLSFPSGASIPNTALAPLTLASWVDGAAFRNLYSSPSLAGQLPYWALVGSLASGAQPVFNGTNNFVGYPYNQHGAQIFKVSGTFIAPAGITTVYLSMIGGGGAGGGAIPTGQGGGGGSGKYVLNYPFTVVPGNSYTVTVGAGGLGVSAADGNVGGDTSFDTLVVTGGNFGKVGAGGVGDGGANVSITSHSPTVASSLAGGFGFGGAAGARGGSSGAGGGSAGSPFGAGKSAPPAGGNSNGNSADANTGAGGSGAVATSGNATGGNGGSGFCAVMY